MFVKNHVYFSVLDPGQEAEYVSTGSVGLKVYWTYLASGSGPWKIFLLLILTVKAQFIFTGTDFWLNFMYVQHKKSASP